MPSLVRGLQPNGRRDEVDGPVAHNQPLVLRFWEHDKTPFFRAKCRRGALRRGPTMAQHQTQLKAERDPTLVSGSGSSEFTLSALVEVAVEDDIAQLHAKVADEQQKRDANRPPLGALDFDVDVGDREIGARQVRRPAELEQQQPCPRRRTMST